MTIEYNNLDKEVVDSIESFESVPCWKLLKMKPISATLGRASVEFKVCKEHLNTLGLCHGGIMATIADTAMSVAMRTTGPIGVTVEINVNFIRGAKEGDVIVAEGEVLHRGNKSVVCESRVYLKNSGKLCAVSRGSFLLKERY